MRNLASDIRQALQMGFRQIFGRGTDGKVGRCALFLALEVACQREGKAVKTYHAPYYYKTVPVHCPVFSCELRSDLIEVVIHLNDDHHWSAENIAVWTDSILPSSIPCQQEQESELVAV